jgi:predicted nuclease of predicted toxin-antitoxin system
VKVRLLLDEDVHLSVAIALRKRGFDVVHVQEVGRKGKTDAEQLRYAVESRRCLCSFNVKDFVMQHNEYMHNEKHHLGIIVSKQLPPGETIRKLSKILTLSSPKSINNQIVFL